MPINLSKDERVSFTKAESSRGIHVSNGWTAKGKDYDLKGLVLHRDGQQQYIGAANDDEVLVDDTGSVRHGGDVTTPGTPEVMDISWSPDIERVALSSYSAMENGPGSFRNYGVYVEAASDAKTVRIAAEDTSADIYSYTCLFAEVIMNPDGTMELVGAEDYSEPNSEKRVGYVKSGFPRRYTVKMDAGPRGRTK